MQEDQLIPLLKQQNRQAWEEAYNRYKETVLKMIYRKIKVEEDAKEVLQEVFVKAFTRIHQFRMESKLSTWLVKIAITTSLNFLESADKRRLSLTRPIETEEQIIVIDDGGDPEQILMRKEQRAILIAVLSRLTDKQRTACTYYFLEGIPQADIAEIMGKTLDAVESLISRGKQKMASSIQIRQNLLV